MDIAILIYSPSVCSLVFCFRKHYLNGERLEEGFDLSGPSNPRGQFCSGKGLGVIYII